MSRRRAIGASILAAATLLVTPGLAGATADATANRLSGPDRFVTARVIAEATFSSATVAILVSGRSFPDALTSALASAYLSGASGLPLLLTEPDHLTDGVIDTMRGMGVSGVQVIGGTAAVSDAVLTTLRDEGFTAERLAGVDRYETARKVAELLPPEAVGTFGAGKAAIIASGESFPDALAAGPMSASQGMPILLTERDGLNAHARAALENLSIQQVLVVGGFEAVSDAVVSQIVAMGIEVRRIAGSNRQATAHEVARVETGELEYPVNRVLLARPDDFADALVGGTRGGKIFAPILLTASRDSLGPEATEFIHDRVESISVVDALGGTAAVSDAVLADAVAAAQGG